MKNIRVVSVGLIVSAYLICTFAIDFYKWEMNNSAPFLFLSAVSYIAPHVVETGGMKVIIAIAYVLACMGVGMWLSSIIYARIESAFCGLFQSLRLLIDQSDYAKQKRQQFVSWLPKREA